MRAVAECGSYGATAAEWADTARALTAVADWVQIANSLTAQPVVQIAQELSIAIGSGADARKADDVLTQFWFGAMLARSGLRPAVPPAAGRRPDFVIRADDMPLSVEVKRPESVHSAMRAIKSATSQIRDYGKPGFIALDLSPALDTDSLIMKCFFDHASAIEQFRPVFLHHSRQISDRIRGYRCEGKFSRILGLLMYARVYAWHHSNTSSPQMSVFVEAPVFPGACGGLIRDTAERVKAALRRGLEELAGGPVLDLG
jgi:hypothetical protein